MALVPIQTAPQQPMDALPDLKDPTLRGAWLNKETARGNLGADHSAAGDDMAPVGAPVAERVGANFDGAADYLRRAEADWRSTDSAGTIIAWVKRSVINADHTIFSTSDELTNPKYFTFHFRVAANDLRLDRSGTSARCIIGGSTQILAGRWYRVALVSDGSSYFMYVNGELETLREDLGTNQGIWIDDSLNRDNVVIGVLKRVADTWLFNGQIKDVRYYSEAKSLSWMRHDFRRGVPDDSLLLHVLDGTRDLSHYERALTRSGGVIAGHDMIFDGADDVIDCGDLGDVQTIMGWVRPGSDTEEIWLVDAGKDVMVSGGTVAYAGLTPVATYVNGVATTAMAAGVWQHLACVIETADANNFELGTDGANFGATRQRDVKVFSEAKSAAFVRAYYLRTRGFF